jgi:hypothetical protein
MWAWPATADDPPPPSSADCLAAPALEGCTPTDDVLTPGEATTPDGITGPDETAGDSQDDEGTTDPAGGGAQPEGTGDPASNGTTARQADAAETGGGAALSLICDGDPVTLLPDCPTEGGTPETPLSCDDLAELLGQDGCPENFACEDLAELLGLEGCPEGAPTCEDLAALLGLAGCPEPPGSCEDVAHLLGLDNCSQIPCIDTSQLPDDAASGLAPLLDALEKIGVQACPAEEPPTGGGSTPTPNSPGVQQTYYENCDDARAEGAAPVYRGQPGYRPGLDSDSDGIGCEDDGAAGMTPVSTGTTTGGGTLAYTGVDLEPLLRLSAILLSAGTLLLLAGQRRT